MVFHRRIEYVDGDGTPAVPGLARRQHGVVASRQLEALGSRRGEIAREVQRGHLIRQYRGVYAVGHDRLTVRGRSMAAVLACGEGGMLSHLAAAALWDLAAIPSGPIDVTAPTARRIEGIRCHRTRSIHPDDRTIIDGIPVTSVPRTLLDRAQTLDPQRLRTLVEQAQRRDLLSSLSLNALMSRRNGRKGTAAAAHEFPTRATRCGRPSAGGTGFWAR